MKNTKTTVRFFNIVEYEKEAAYLHEMHLKGWRFTGFNMPVFFHFERCEPEDVVYQLDYHQEGAGSKQDYIRMFEDCGWEYLQDCMGYSYFRKPAEQMNGSEEIFCDEESRLDMLKRIFQGRVRILLILFCAVLIPGFFLYGPASNRFEPLIFGLYIVLIAIYLMLFIKILRYYFNLRDKAIKKQ